MRLARLGVTPELVHVNGVTMHLSEARERLGHERDWPLLMLSYWAKPLQFHVPWEWCIETDLFTYF